MYKYKISDVLVAQLFNSGIEPHNSPPQVCMWTREQASKVVPLR